jgi:carbamoyltransferase
MSSQIRARRERSNFIAHAASVFLVSPFEEAAILTVDGVGEDATTTLGRGKGSQITLTHEMDFPHSLGLLYSTVTAWLGFKPNNGEGKVVGLASYGEPTFREEFRDVIHITDDGSFRLNMKYFDYHKRMRMYSRHFIRKFGPPLSAEDVLGETSRNMSATLTARVSARSRPWSPPKTGKPTLICTSTARLCCSSAT